MLLLAAAPRLLLLMHHLHLISQFLMLWHPLLPACRARSTLQNIGESTNIVKWGSHIAVRIVQAVRSSRRWHRSSVVKYLCSLPILMVLLFLDWNIVSLHHITLNILNILLGYQHLLLLIMNSLVELARATSCTSVRLAWHGVLGIAYGERLLPLLVLGCHLLVHGILLLLLLLLVHKRSMIHVILCREVVHWGWH